jgi:hypothetical protein
MTRPTRAMRTHPKPEKNPERQVPDAGQPQVKLSQLELGRGCTADSWEKHMNAAAWAPARTHKALKQVKPAPAPCWA